MKVKEYIEYLQTLDQEKNIWIIYDTFFCYTPMPSCNLTKSQIADLDIDDEDDVQVGDYGIEVG